MQEVAATDGAHLAGREEPCGGQRANEVGQHAYVVIGLWEHACPTAVAGEHESAVRPPSAQHQAQILVGGARGTGDGTARSCRPA